MNLYLSLLKKIIKESFIFEPAIAKKLGRSKQARISQISLYFQLSLRLIENKVQSKFSWKIIEIRENFPFFSSISDSILLILLVSSSTEF